MTIISF